MHDSPSFMPRGLRARFRERYRTQIYTKLTVSHIAVVALSLFVFASLGFVFYLFLLYAYGASWTDQLGAIIVLTFVVLVVIMVITACSIVVALAASRIVSRRLIVQIAALESATEAIASGQLDQRVAVRSEDELGRLAARFNHLAERLEELDAQRRSFVASISHDLRTPIAIIRGQVDSQLRERDDETPRPAEAFRAIEHEAMTLGKLVEDLFTLSRLEEAALPMESRPVDLAILIEDAVRGLRPYALKASRVSVNAHVAPDLPPVLGDATRLTQVLNSLLHNAVRHTPEGGVVIAEAEAMPEAGLVRLAVRDTGVGISPDKLPQIFDRFYQGDPTRSGGAGLGLSIVKQLVEIQGGTVAAESTQGEGTMITIDLRVAGHTSDVPLRRPVVQEERL